MEKAFAPLATGKSTPVAWDSLGRFSSHGGGPTSIVASEWTSGNLPLALAAGSGANIITEDRLYDALERVVAVRSSTPNGGTSISHRFWWGNTLVSEEWNNGWRRNRYPGLGIDAPLGYTINCSGGDCVTPPLGVDIDGAALSASSPQATYLFAQDLGRDMVMLVDIHGVAVERYRYETYGHRTIAEPGAGDVCNDADDRTCQSRFGNPLGHAGAMRSPITGVYEMRARLYAPAMRVFLSTDPLGYVDAFDRWLYVGGDPVNFWDPFGMGVKDAYVDPCRNPSSRACTIAHVGDTALGNEPSISREELDAHATPGDEFMCGFATGSECDLDGGWSLLGDIIGSVFPHGPFRDAAIAISSGDPQTIGIEAAAAAAGPAADGLRAIKKIVGGVGEAAVDTVASVVSREAGDVAGDEGAALFEYYLKQVEELDVSTSTNGAVFYSGPGQRALAEEFAVANDRRTLEMTTGGGWLHRQDLYDPSNALSKDQADAVWRRLSTRFAEGASGNAIGFVVGASPGGIFGSVEYPALRRNVNVTNVITGGN